ncbi:MAG: hypothetical protein A3F84_25425 [Candidatus Handelsmanbacteria bacterium RIFCSPLOWO2_12_FULL_64_10]|uniref:histidine kinase n=1 Tax=Handelsmanbacteria sp. (strain RIFCSPLOWO2_12_FULL_64_10) TaxID=1817868 RepID=A0A1F6CU42_HANXR|nr:MAG: hypothetical protein A3F84_25425 [Candidatus Handelsmanbacteria bacterium RIFCSPLOWO2_12_FULL_64_10]
MPWLFILNAGLCGATERPPAVRQEDPASQARAWRSFDRNDGLIDGVIRAICQARDGSVWFAGMQGVCRYDGMSWTIYDSEKSGAPAGTHAIIQARDGTIWVGSGKGVGRFDGETWRTYTEADGLPGPLVLAVCETRDGTIWVGCGKRWWLASPPPGGLARWNGQAWKVFRQNDGLVQEHVNAIYEARDGALWVGTEGGVSRYDGQNWTSYTVRDGLPDERVLAVCQAADGAMWFGTGRGVARYANGRWTPYAPGGEGRPVQSLHQAQDGTLWAYSESALYRFDPSDSLRAGGEGWSRCKIPAPGPGDVAYISKMYGTENDVLWLAGARAVRFDCGGTKWASYRGLAGPPYQDPDGTLWFRAPGGAVAFDGSAWKPSQGVEWPVYRTPQGVFWCGGEGGIRSHDGRTWRTYPGILDKLRTITLSRSGRLWFTGTREGRSTVACYDGEARSTPSGRSGQAHSTRSTSSGQAGSGQALRQSSGQALRQSSGQALRQSSGQAWKTFTEEDWGKGVSLARKVVESPNGDLWFVPDLGTRDDVGYGVVRFDGTRWHHYTVRGDQAVNETNRIGNRVYDLAIDGSGRPWAATVGGLWHLDSARGDAFVMETETAGRKTVRVYIARDGGLWVACAGNIKQNATGVLRRKAGAWTTFTTEDGLVGNDVWAILESEDGALWFGTTTGVSRFDGRSWMNYGQEDGLLEDDVRFIFQDVRGALWLGNGSGNRAWTTRYRPDRLPPETTLTFLPGEELSSGNLILEWSGKDAWKDTPVEDLVYSWQMGDGSWSPFSPEVKHVFFDLPSGAHAFRVRAMDRDGNVDPIPATYAFTVLPPVWRQPWFIGLMVVLVGAISFQTARVVRRNMLLRASNAALSAATKELFGRNQELREKTEALDESNQKLDESNAALTSVNQDLFVLNKALQEKTEALEQANVRLQEVDALKTVFFSNVSHELRTPMTAIKGYVDNLLDGIAGELSDRQARYLGRVRANADRLTRLINDLLDLSRIDRGQTDLLQLNIQKVPVKEAVFEAVESLRPMAEVEGLQLRFEGEEAYGMADRDRLVQIVTNLVGNAIKFTPTGGEVEVRVGEKTGNGETEKRGSGASPTPRLPDSPVQGWVVVGVRDTGRGIPREDLGRIFDRFYQVKGGGGHPLGTGLGLPIAKELVELQGGRIWAESEAGKGSAFWFTLPAAK